VTEAEIRQAHLAGGPLKQAELDRFASLNVNALDLGSPWPLFRDRVVFEDRGLFDFTRDVSDENAVNIFTIGVIGIDGLIDLVAWAPKTGGRIALWLGRGFALGEAQIFGPHLEPFPIWRSPLGWLKAGRRGIVSLRPSAAYVMLADVPSFLVEDIDHGRELDRTLTPPRPTGRILVTQAKTGRAA
jgi:hypothetical protein